MANYYYSGQGTLYVGQRNPTTGRPQGLVSVGNVPSLELSIEVTKFEHKESESGNRTVDLTIVQEQNMTFNMVMESINSRNLAMAFFGSDSQIPSEEVEDEEVILYAPLDADTPMKSPLAHINIDAETGIVLEDSLSAAMTEGEDFAVDYETGTVWALEGWSGASLPDTCTVTYTHKGYPKVSGFTQTNVERYLRFEGINTVNGDRVVVDLFRAQFDPAQSFPLINDEVAQLQITGNVLRDTLNAEMGSEFFVERKTIDVEAEEGGGGEGGGGGGGG